MKQQKLILLKLDSLMQYLKLQMMELGVDMKHFCCIEK